MADDGLINFRVVATVPGDFKVRRAYNASNQVQYLGYAERGTDEADPRWVIKRYTYSSNLITEENIAKNVAWDDRTTSTYS